MVDAVESPSVKERQGKCSVKNASRFSDYADLWFKQWGIAPSPMALHTATLKKHISQVYGKMVLKEITPTLLREHCERIRDRGAPFTAVLIRNIVWKVFKFAQDRGYEGDNPVYRIRAGGIAKFKLRDRTLTERVIGQFLNGLNCTGHAPSMRMLPKLLMLTMLRKSELVYAKWAWWTLKKEP